MTFFNHPCCLSLGLRFAKLVDARLLAERSHRGYRFNVQIEEVFQDYGIIYGGFLNWWTPKSSQNWPLSMGKPKVWGSHILGNPFGAMGGIGHQSIFIGI